MGLATVSKTVQDILTDVKRTFGDESAVQITDADIIRWANSAQREILITNPILRATGTTDITAGVSEYPMAGLNIVAIQSIHFKGRKLEYRSFQEAEEFIQSADPDKAGSGDPVMWFEWGSTINLYPVPTATIVGGLTVYYIKEPTPLTIAASPLSVPDSYYENILQFVLSKAYELDEDSANSEAKMNQFNQRLNTLSEQESTPTQDFYPRITIREEDAW